MEATLTGDSTPGRATMRTGSRRRAGTSRPTSGEAPVLGRLRSGESLRACRPDAVVRQAELVQRWQRAVAQVGQHNLKALGRNAAEH